ncbi:MAG: pseudoazurin [Pseudomonadota bacterium]
MDLTLSRRTFIAATTAFAVARPVSAATTHEVQMLNQDPDNPRLRMVFSPRILKVMPGDTVKFLNADRGHNSELIRGMGPAGGEEWKGRINEEVEVTLTTPGVYGYQCAPHATVGMVGIIVVGDGAPANLADAQGVRQRGRARQAFEEIWAEAGEMGLLG